jgi:hypothetical protein
MIACYKLDTSLVVNQCTNKVECAKYNVESKEGIRKGKARKRQTDDLGCVDDDRARPPADCANTPEQR